MSLNKNYWPLFFACLLAFIVHSQDTKDSIPVNNLKEVIVTGESQVMSLSKKLFTVGVVDQKGIKRLAGNNLADVLTQNLNITVVPDASTGKSTVSMFGLDGQYVKLLFDGIPMASDNGIGNNIDITQINLEDVERIEVIEGSAGVLYGDNAVAGVINIVTKRSLEEDRRWQIQASAQEETVGSEFSFFDRGRHIQNLKLSNQISPKTNLTVGASRNDYAGFYNGFQGKDHAKIENNLVVNDGLRGTEWNPKEQLTVYGNLNSKLGKHNLFLKLQYFDEALSIYNRTVNGRLDAVTGLVNPTALDEDYNTKRWVNNLNVSGPLKGATNYNVSISYQNQKRYFEQYTYNILQRGIESYVADDLNQSSDILYSKGFVSNLVPESNFFNALLGYEVTRQKGFDAVATGANSTDVVENTLENYDVFASADLNFSDKFSVYPGLRSVNNSQFGGKLVWSLSSTYDFSTKTKLKLALGSAFRAPNFSELFFYFVDANHNVQGNPNLGPEDGISIFLNANHLFELRETTFIKSTLTSFYYDIEDKIASVVDADENNRALFTFGNVDQQRILGFSLTNKLNLGQWQAGLGASYIGQDTTIDETDQDDTGYLWSFNLNSNLSYSVPRIKTTFSAFLKYSGRTQNVVPGDNGIEIGETKDFSFLDASVRTRLIAPLDLTVGARNLLDVVSVNATDIPAGAHGASGGTARLFGNGRSYFLKLLYTLNL